MVIRHKIWEWAHAKICGQTVFKPLMPFIPLNFQQGHAAQDETEQSGNPVRGNKDTRRCTEQIKNIVDDIEPRVLAGVFEAGLHLVIGSTVVNVLLSVPRLPRRGEDINIGAAAYRLEGCAYNVYKTLRLFESSALLI
jgi:hypothetical protein